MLSGRYVELSQDAMLIIVWLESTSGLCHRYNLVGVSAYNIVEVVHVWSHLVFVDTVTDEWYVASMNVGNGLDVNGIYNVSIFVWGNGASESSLDLSA